MTYIELAVSFLFENVDKKKHSGTFLPRENVHADAWMFFWKNRLKLVLKDGEIFAKYSRL